MSFANPAFLFALSLLAIPVIIHLFNFRKFKRILFTNVALLEELKEQTQSTSRIRNLLILLARLLCFACLILAFSEPYLPGETKSDGIIRTIGVYIDNSPSMGSKGKEGILLVEAIAKGKSIIEAFPENTSFILCTNNSGAKLQRELTKSEALDEVELIKEGTASKTALEAYKKLQAIANGKPLSSFIISDFQQSTTRVGELLASKAKNCSLVPVSANAGSNLAIDSVWFSTPTHLINGKEELGIKLSNFGQENLDNTNLELFINGEPAGLSTVSVPKGSSVNTTIAYTNKKGGQINAEIKVNDAPIVFDNSYFFNYRVNDKLKVYEVSSSSAAGPMQALFNNDADYQYFAFTEQNIDYNRIKGSGTLILNGLNSISSGLQNVIVEKLKNGESVAIFPSPKADLASYNSLLDKITGTQFSGTDTAKVKVSSLESRHPFYANIFDKTAGNLDLPISKGGYQIKSGSFGKLQALLKLQNGNSFLSVAKYKGGNFYLFNTPLQNEYSNFAQHGLFAPIMLRIAETSGYIQQLAYTIGDPNPIEVKADTLPKEDVFKLKSIGKEGKELIPQSKKANDQTLLYPPAEDLTPGNYSISAGEGASLLDIGVNLARTESNTAITTEEKLKELESKSNGGISILNGKAEKINSQIKNGYQEAKLWKLFVLLAFAFLCAEIFLTKWLQR